MLLLDLPAVDVAAADMMHDVRNWEVVDSAVAPAVGFDVVEGASDTAVVEVESDIVVAHGEV